MSEQSDLPKTRQELVSLIFKIAFLEAMALSIILPSVTSTGEIPVPLQQGALTCVMPQLVQFKVCSYSYPKAFMHPTVPFITSTHPGYSFYENTMLFPNTDGNFTVTKNFEIARTDGKDTNATETSFNPSGVFGIMAFAHYRSDINGFLPAQGSQIKIQWSLGNSSTPLFFDFSNTVVNIDVSGFSLDSPSGIFINGGPCATVQQISTFTCWNNSTSPVSNLLTFTQDPNWVTRNNMISNIPGRSATVIVRVVGNSVTPFTANFLSIGLYIFRIQFLKYFINTISNTNFSIFLVYQEAPAVSSSQEFNADWLAIDGGCIPPSTTSGVDNIAGCGNFG